MHNDCFSTASQKKMFQDKLRHQATIFPVKFTTAVIKLAIKLLKIESSKTSGKIDIKVE